MLLARSGTHRLHTLVTGLLALDHGDAATATDCATRFLRRIGESDRLERVAGLELLVRAQSACGDVDDGPRCGRRDRRHRGDGGARRRCGRRRCSLRDGSRAAGEHETLAALAAIEDAVDLYTAAGARYDAALARLELATVLRDAGRAEEAARRDSAAADSLRNARCSAAGSAQDGLLSPREREVLRLVAQGRSNDQIATDLVLSVRTVERHVANAYAKIGVSGRTARAAATAWAHAHGIA